MPWILRLKKLKYWDLGFANIIKRTVIVFPSVDSVSCLQVIPADALLVVFLIVHHSKLKQILNLYGGKYLSSIKFRLEHETAYHGISFWERC